MTYTSNYMFLFCFLFWICSVIVQAHFFTISNDHRMSIVNWWLLFCHPKLIFHQIDDCILSIASKCRKFFSFFKIKLKQKSTTLHRIFKSEQWNTHQMSHHQKLNLNVVHFSTIPCTLWGKEDKQEIHLEQKRCNDLLKNKLEGD